MIKSNVKKVLGVFLLVGGLVMPFQDMLAAVKPQDGHFRWKITVQGDGVTQDKAMENLEKNIKIACPNGVYSVQTWRQNNPYNYPGERPNNVFIVEWYIIYADVECKY